MELNERLQKAMDARGMKQADVCRATNGAVSTSKLAMIMSGKTKDPYLSTVIALCSALHISLAYLAGHTDDVDG